MDLITGGIALVALIVIITFFLVRSCWTLDRCCRSRGPHSEFLTSSGCALRRVKS